MNDEEVAAAATANAHTGATWLDEHRPGWAGIVNPDTLDMSSPGRCIIGQLYGGYDAHICAVLNIASPTDESTLAEEGELNQLRASLAHEHGFWCHPTSHHDFADGDGVPCHKIYQELTIAWITEILLRRAMALA